MYAKNKTNKSILYCGEKVRVHSRFNIQQLIFYKNKKKKTIKYR